MAVKGSNKNRKSVKDLNSRKKTSQNKYEGKSLLERMSLPNAGRNHKKTETGNSAVGLRVVNGKLLSANDVGVLLRDAEKRTNSRRSAGPKQRPVKKTITSTRRTERTITRREPARGKMATPKPYGKDLYLSVSGGKIDSGFLRIRNLPLGSNSQVLEDLVENLTGVKISRSSLVDLPSGSVTAELWLSNADRRLLADVRSRLDGANVDGRVIFAEVSTT